MRIGKTEIILVLGYSHVSMEREPQHSTDGGQHSRFLMGYPNMHWN